MIKPIKLPVRENWFSSLSPADILIDFLKLAAALPETLSA
jgi:hypothetical protein